LGGAESPVFLALRDFALPDHEYGTSASRGVIITKEIKGDYKTHCGRYSSNFHHRNADKES